MKKLLLSVCLLLTASLTAVAGEVLHIHTVTGGDVMYSFSEKPVLTFNTTEMTLTTNTTTVKYPLSELSSFSFSKDDADGIESVMMSEPKGDASVSIFTLEGKLVRSVKAKNGMVRYSLDELPAGSYIVKSSTKSYKIIKK